MVGDFQSSVVAFAVPLGLHEEQIAALSEEDRGCHLSLRKSGGRWESISQSVLMFLEWSSANCYVVAFRDDEVLRLAYIAMLWLRAQAATVGHAVVYGLREVGAGFRSKEALRQSLAGSSHVRTRLPRWDFDFDRVSRQSPPNSFSTN